MASNNYMREINRHLKEMHNLGFTGNPLYDFHNKELCLQDLIDEKLLQILSMFDYEGLPQNFNKHNIELYLLTFGFCAIIEHNGELWPMFGGLTGVPKSPVYQPTQITIANPALNISGTYTDGVDAVIIRNDTFYNGVMEILRRYCTLLVEGNLSLLMWSNFGSRLTAAISSDDENTRKSEQDFIDNIIAGKYTTIYEDGLGEENIRVNPLLQSGNTGGILQLLELLQYIDAEFNKKFGLSSNNNRKREALSSDETSTDDSILLPYIDNMRYYREEGLDRVNKLFGTNWSLKKGSSWELIEKEMEAVVEQLEEEPEEQEEVDKEEEDVKDATDSE